MPAPRIFLLLLLFASLSLTAPAVRALEQLNFSLPDQVEDGLAAKLRGASLLRQAQREADSAPQDIFAAALADYRRLTETLYANGYYSGRISIRLDGREAALIPAYAPPAAVRSIEVRIDPGAPFRFGQTRIAPLAPDTLLPEGFASGKRARAETLIAASRAGIEGWRRAGHARATVAGQELIADHARHRLDADIGIAPGPVVTFGPLLLQGGSKVRRDRIVAIAGLPQGQRFSPTDLEQAANRLRRSGAFRSVALREGALRGPDNAMEVEATLVDALPRRFGAGIELSNRDGLHLSGFWLHRNLLGGAERFRVDAEISDIAASHSGPDYALGLRLERPATFGPDTTGFLRFDLLSEQEPNHSQDVVELALGANRRFGDHLSGSAELAFSHARSDDAFGSRSFTLASLPLKLEWDRRDIALNPQRGHYVETTLTPYLGLDGTESGAQLRLDSRLYRPLAGNRLVAALRLQMGAVLGSSQAGTAPEFLFYSGGGGTVRGHPFQSLGVATGGSTAGGRSFVGLSAELRGKITDTISLVGFADAGYVGAESIYDGSGAWHSGAGLGLRYDTTLGPIRLDVAGPLTGTTGSGVQIYIGIGQAF